MRKRFLLLAIALGVQGLTVAPVTAQSPSDLLGQIIEVLDIQPHHAIEAEPLFRGLRDGAFPAAEISRAEEALASREVRDVQSVRPALSEAHIRAWATAPLPDSIEKHFSIRKIERSGRTARAVVVEISNIQDRGLPSTHFRTWEIFLELNQGSWTVTEHRVIAGS